MTKASGKGHARRPVNYWSRFNEWWRLVLEESGRRPDAAAINRWYEENAHDIWSPDAMPTMMETRIHAKCLRSVDEVRNYFRAYRAQRRADAMARMDAGGGGDDQGDDTDFDAVAVARGRKGASGAGGRSTSASSANLNRGGVSKVVASNGRPGRPSAQASSQPTVPYNGSQNYGNHSVVQVNKAAIRMRMADNAGGLNQWWPSDATVRTHTSAAAAAAAAVAAASRRQQTSAISSGIPGSSAVITGFPHPSDHMRYRAVSYTQPASPAKVDNSAVNGLEGPPDVDVGDLPYDGPCSSVSTTSLDDLFDLRDENDPTKDEVNYGATHDKVGATGALVASVVGVDSHGRSSTGGPGSGVPCGQQQQQQQGLPQQQQQFMTLGQQPLGMSLQDLQQQQHPVLRTSGLMDGLDSIFDDCMEPALHAELTLLPSQGPKHVGLSTHQAPVQVMQMQGPQDQPQLNPRTDGHGCVETTVWPSSMSMPPRAHSYDGHHLGFNINHHSAAAANGRAPHFPQPQAGPDHFALQQQKHQPPPQYPEPMYGWQQFPVDLGIDGSQKVQAAADGSGHGSGQGAAQAAASSAMAWTRGSVQAGVETTPVATTMEGVVSEPPSSKGSSSNNMDWLAPGGRAKGNSPELDKSAGVGAISGMACAEHQQCPQQHVRGHEMQNAGLSPDATSSLSQMAAPVHALKQETSDPPQSACHGSPWLQDRGDTSGGLPAGGSSGALQSAPAPPSQPWLGATMHSDPMVPGAGSDRDLHIQMMQQMPHFGSAPVVMGKSGQVATDSVQQANQQPHHHHHQQHQQQDSAHHLAQQERQAQQQQQYLQRQKQQQRLEAAGPFARSAQQQGQLPPLPPSAPRQQCDRQQHQQQHQYRRSPSLGSTPVVVPMLTPNTAPTGPAPAPNSASRPSVHPSPPWGIDLVQQQPQQSMQLLPQQRSHSFCSGMRPLQLPSAVAGPAVPQQMRNPQQPQCQLATASSVPIPPSLPPSFLTSGPSARVNNQPSAGAAAASQDPARSGPWPNIREPAALFAPGPSPFEHFRLPQPGSMQPMPVPSLPSPTLTQSDGGAGPHMHAPGHGPVPSPSSMRRHSQPGNDMQQYIGMPYSSPQTHPGPVVGPENASASGCPMADLLARWQQADIPEPRAPPAQPQQQQQPPPPQQQQPQLKPQQLEHLPFGARKLEPIAVGGLVGYVASTGTGPPLVVPPPGLGGRGTARDLQAAINAATGVFSSSAAEAALAAASRAVDPAPAAQTQPRPTLVRTLSAPAGDGLTPRSTAATVFCGTNNVQPQAHPGATPRHQVQPAQPAGALSGQGMATPGGGLGFGSPPGCWGDRALTELEVDSFWLSNMLAAGDMTPPYF